MNIIIDACAILAVLLDDGNKEFIINKSHDKSFIAPDCLDYEIGNALANLIKRNKVSTEEAISVFGEYQKIPLRKEKIDVMHAIKIAGKNNMYAYDAYYIVCAMHYNVPLLTLDQKLIQIATQEGVLCL